MNVLFTVYAFVLFFVLTPGVLLRLPHRGSKVMVAFVHGLVFAAILVVSGHYVYNRIFEGLDDPGHKDAVTLMKYMCKMDLKKISPDNKTFIDQYKNSKFNHVKVLARSISKINDEEVQNVIALACDNNLSFGYVKSKLGYFGLYGKNDIVRELAKAFLSFPKFKSTP
jgi:hypothetical protein